MTKQMRELKAANNAIVKARENLLMSYEDYSKETATLLEIHVKLSKDYRKLQKEEK